MRFITRYGPASALMVCGARPQYRRPEATPESRAVIVSSNGSAFRGLPCGLLRQTLRRLHDPAAEVVGDDVERPALVGVPCRPGECLRPVMGRAELLQMGVWKRPGTDEHLGRRLVVLEHLAVQLCLPLR